MQSKIVTTPADASAPKRLFNIEEAAHYLGATPWAVRRLLWAGKLDFVRVGKRHSIPRESLDQFVDQNLRRAAAPIPRKNTRKRAA